MKQVVLLCDGMADMPCDSLGGKTPMEAAHKPAMDALARTAEVGACQDRPGRDGSRQRCGQPVGVGL